MFRIVWDMLCSCFKMIPSVWYVLALNWLILVCRNGINWSSLLSPCTLRNWGCVWTRCRFCCGSSFWFSQHFSFSFWGYWLKCLERERMRHDTHFAVLQRIKRKETLKKDSAVVENVNLCADSEKWFSFKFNEIAWRQGLRILAHPSRLHSVRSDLRREKEQNETKGIPHSQREYGNTFMLSGNQCVGGKSSQKDNYSAEWKWNGNGICNE